MYQRAFGFGTENDSVSSAENGGYVLTSNGAMPQSEGIDAAGNGSELSTGAAIGIAGLFGGVLLIAVLAPFGIGAVAGAVAAPEGRRKTAAKWGALAGGLGGMVAYPIFSGLTGSTAVAGSLSSLTPIVLGAYMGVRERDNVD